MQEMEETRIEPLGHKDPLEKGMATDSITLTWRIPWTEESGGLKSIGPHIVRYNRSNLARTRILSANSQSI